jgi:hypothetical protein
MRTYRASETSTFAENAAQTANPAGVFRLAHVMPVVGSDGKCDQRGILARYTVTDYVLENMTKDPLVIKFSQPRARIIRPENIVTREAVRLINLPPRTQSNYKPLRFTVASQDKQNIYGPAIQTFSDGEKAVQRVALADYTILRPIINSESNTPYDKDALVLKLTAVVKYLSIEEPDSVTAVPRPEGGFFWEQKHPTFESAFHVDPDVGGVTGNTIIFPSDAAKYKVGFMAEGKTTGGKLYLRDLTINNPIESPGPKYLGRQGGRLTVPGLNLLAFKIAGDDDDAALSCVFQWDGTGYAMLNANDTDYMKIPDGTTIGFVPECRELVAIPSGDIFLPQLKKSTPSYIRTYSGSKSVLDDVGQVIRGVTAVVRLVKGFVGIFSVA